MERRLEQSLKQDKGCGCETPRLDPFSKEVTQFDKDILKIMCLGTDWVKCYHSKCSIVPKILNTTDNIVCSYQDIIYESDQKCTIGPPTEVRGDNEYVLTKSDHVKVKCSGKHRVSILPSKWIGHSLGFRSTVLAKFNPKGRGDSLNVLILGFDSTSKNGFIRKMPKSYKVLKDTLGATILNGYNIVGDGTPAALFPILTGKTECELPDVRKKMKNNRTLDDMPFIFYKLKDEGYANVRDTLQGKLEERLPLMAIRLPDKLKKRRTEAEKNLKENVEVLTTPHDIYATVLDVLDLTQFTNTYRVKGADLTRGLKKYTSFD